MAPDADVPTPAKRIRSPVCKIDLKWEELPNVLRSALHGHMQALRRKGEYEGQPFYAYVTRQSGGTAHKQYQGWQVQLSIKGDPKLRRIAKVNHSKVGALAAVAALADSSLQDMVAMRQWMYGMAAGGDVMAENWLSTVDLSTLPARRACGGRPSSSIHAYTARQTQGNHDVAREPVAECKTSLTLE